jgi:hypothetical protein
MCGKRKKDGWYRPRKNKGNKPKRKRAGEATDDITHDHADDVSPTTDGSNSNCSTESTPCGDLLQEVRQVLFTNCPNNNNIMMNEATNGHATTGMNFPQQINGAQANPPSHVQANMAAPQMPWLHDIFQQLYQVNSRLDDLATRFVAMEQMQKQVHVLGTELSELRTSVNDVKTNIDQQLGSLTQNTADIKSNMAETNLRLKSLESENQKLKSCVVDLQCRSMRNNLIFTQIEESNSETNEQTEKKLRDFLVDKMKLQDDRVAEIQFDRVHRMGKPGNGPRQIIAKFSVSKDKELVKQNGKELKSTSHSVFEQFPEEINIVRRKLVPIMKQAIKDGHKARLVVNKLYIDGKLYNPV